MYKKYRTSLNKDQSGFAAFAITMIMMIVLSLIVLGFAASARNEQRRALDNQLSMAAYYASESGINDAYAVIKSDLANGTSLPAQNTCTGAYNTTSNVLESNAGVAYTCLLVNPTPPSLEYAPISTGHGQVVPVFGSKNETITSIKISWQQDGLTAAANFSGCPGSTINSFYPEASWPTNCSAGVLQVDIVPASGWISESTLQTVTQTVFLEPVNGASNSSNVVNGNIDGVKCSAPPSGGEYDCSETLTGLGQAGYYLRFIPIYKNADVSITAYNSSRTQLNLKNAQVLIDSTGKASDELRRVQERVSINPLGNNDVPINALQAKDGICKMFTVRPSQVSVLTSCP
jgi:hypothetical protein